MASINTNIAAYFAQNNLRAASEKSQMSIARLSSGNKIVRASDDVAALSVGTILRTDVNTLKTALTNTNQGSTLLQVADGAMARLGEILQRQKALSVQANAGTLSDNERGYLNQEFQKLREQYDSIVKSTNFNGINLLDGGLNSSGSSVASAQPTTANDFTAVVDSGTTLGTISSAGSFDWVTSGGSKDIANNILGKLSSASVQAVGADLDNAQLIVSINGTTYKSAVVDIDGQAANFVFTPTDSNMSKFQINVKDQNGGSLAALASGLQSDLRAMTIYQNRAISNSASVDGSITTDKFADTLLSGMDGSSFVLNSKDYNPTTGNMPSISDFKIVSNSATDASFFVKVNGKLYSKENVTVDSDISDNNLGGGNGIIRLTSVDDSNSTLDVHLADAASVSGGGIGITKASEASALQNALNQAFGSGSTGGLDFQIGTKSSDKISVSIGGVGTTDIFKDDSGVTQTLDISTQAGAVTASDVLGNAIKALTSARADVGATQSRFSYAAATLEVSIQNLDAARGQFLDADISEESTAFATSQVLQQASISVLAQANQLPQNLLKLIG